MRTFIAIDLEPAVKRAIGALQQDLRPHCGKLRWVNPESCHLTLKFLGEIAEKRVTEVAEALDACAADTAPFDIGLDTLGTFGSRGQVRVCWLGITDSTGELTACQAACEQQLESIGIPRESRPFKPHLTIARNKTPRHSAAIAQAIADAKWRGPEVQGVDALTFYQSVLERAGPTYVALSRHPLTGTG